MSEFIGTKLTMNLGERSYDIIVKSGSLENLYQFARLDRRVAVVTDSGVPAQYAQMVADQCKDAHIITVPQGEASKSFKILESVLKQMLEFGMGRGDLVIAVGGWTLFQRLDQMEQQYYDLANSVGNITYSVNSQIGSITDRVEEVLKAQNDLTADYGTQLVSADLASNTGTFSLRAVPKTYTPGMSVIFLADNGEETLEFPAQEGENGTFTGEAACTLTDTITLSAVFVTGDTRQTQLLDQYVDLYSDSLPQIDVNSLLSIFEVEEYDQGDGSFVIPEEYVTVSDGQNGSSVSAVWEQLGVSQLRKVEVGLFYNEKLVQWLTPCQKPSNYKGFEGEDFYRLDPVTLTMEEGDVLEIAARGTDQYGRQWVALGGAFQVKDGELTHPDSYAIFSNPAHWDFTT